MLHLLALTLGPFPEFQAPFQLRYTPLMAAFDRFDSHPSVADAMEFNNWSCSEEVEMKRAPATFRLTLIVSFLNFVFGVAFNF